MVKGVSIRFRSYKDTIPRLLKLINLDKELKKYSKIVLKPSVENSHSPATSPEFVESVLKFCLENKNPAGEVFIAEGSDGEETMSLFDELGYRTIAEKYNVGLVDLNDSESEEVYNENFLKFITIKYPSILKEAFIISLPVLAEDPEIMVRGSLSNMVGAYPSKHYKGFFAKTKTKIKKWPLRYAIHDIVLCKTPNLAIVDASSKGAILTGKPFEVDKRSAELLGFDWKNVPHLKMMEDIFEDK